MSRLFTLIRSQEEVHLEPGQSVIPKDLFSMLKSAEELMDQAQKERDELLKATEERCEELKNQAREEGLQEGLSQFNEKLLKLDEEIKRVHHEMNQLILPLALKAAKKIVGTELHTHPETIVDIVMQAITPALQAHQVTIWVNKADLEFLETEKKNLKEKLERAQHISIKPRDDIERGGGVIETESGIINFQVENQWRALEKAFEKYLKGQP